MWTSLALAAVLATHLAPSNGVALAPTLNPIRIAVSQLPRTGQPVTTYVAVGSFYLVGMAYAVFQVRKPKSSSAATAATQHNYRTRPTPNADPQLQHQNQELVNHEQRPYGELAKERIAELQLKRLRRDHVPCVEIVLSGSPEAFKRDASGRAEDMRGSQWLQDNLDFLQRKFGARNVIGCMLHQDEATPHIHALVVPVTEDGRLSSRDVFSPRSLRELQTEYAQAMAPHGMERGIRYSTALHEDVRRHHGAQNTSQQELAQLTAPLAYQPFELTPMKLREQLSPQAYLEREGGRVNAYASDLFERVNLKLELVSRVATANTLAHDRARVLEKQLANSKETELSLVTALQARLTELTAEHRRSEELSQQLLRVGMQVLQDKTVPQALVTNARQSREASRQKLEQLTDGILQQPLASWDEFRSQLTAKGYSVSGEAPHQLQVSEPTTGSRFRPDELQPNGQELLSQVERTIERTRQQQEQARRLELAQDPRAMQVVITARDNEQALRIQEALEQAGANVWSVQSLASAQLQIKVSYAFDWKTIEPISAVLEKVKRSPGAELEESYAHNVTRTGAVRTAQLERGRSNEREEELER